MEKINENIDNKYENFLELLNTNPEAIEDQAMKNEYRELLNFAFEKARHDIFWAKVLSSLLNSNIINKNEIKDTYKELVWMIFESAKENLDWTEVVPLLNLNILEKNEIKDKYIDLLDVIFNKAKGDNSWEKLIPSLLRLNILDESEIKDKYKDKCIVLLKKYFDNVKESTFWADVALELIKMNILDKSDKELYIELLKISLNDSVLTRDVLPSLLGLNILDESDKEFYKDLLETAFRESKYNTDWAKNIIPSLLKMNILDENEIKDNYKDKYIELLERIITYSYDDIKYVEIIPPLLKMNILDRREIKDKYKDKYTKLLEIAFKYSYDDFRYAELIPSLLKLNILDESEINDNYKDKYIVLLEKSFENVKESASWASIIPELFKMNILDESEINEYKDKYIETLEFTFDEAKGNRTWLEMALLPLLSVSNIFDKNSIRDKCKELAKIAFGTVKDTSNCTGEVLPILLNLYEFDENDINTLKNLTLVGTDFLEKNKGKFTIDDIEFLDNLDETFTKEEIQYIYSLSYESFEELKIAVKENNYQKIWELKKEFYTDHEKETIDMMEGLTFKTSIWTYFVDKVPGNKLLKNRFRDPHNALLRPLPIMALAEDLSEKGFSKQDFVKNYLGVAGDRNNGYQQLNDFADKYKSNWKELVEGVMNIDEFKENKEFMNLAEGILEQEKTGELYKNLDNFEQILTLLHMIGNKDALIKLQKLSESGDPKDKQLYEYYKGAIYHPRTKPIIMKMYEDPGEFLGLDDTTFSDLERIHQAKKPSNMVENFEFLDFDAKDLVDCLPLGIYDQLSYFKPFEMKFYMSGNDVFTKEELQQKISEFLLGIDQKRISVIITKLKEQGDETMWFKEWKANKEEFIKKLLGKYGAEDLINMFVNLGYSEFNKYKDLRLMTAKISPKSDPNNRFNGFNCDSLAEGHGKKVVAMFNPYCTDFCIYEGDQDPKEDNLKVTSWVTLNRAIPENFTKLLDKVKSETTHDIVSVLGDKFEDYRDPSEYVITMDNIEANPNFGSKNELAVRKMYEKFFSEYVRQNPISPNGIPINTSKFYSGVNYNKLDILTDRVPNESLPVFVNAYSDNSASYSLQGKLDAGEQKEKEKKTGIQPLSIEDVVQISYMEGKIYPASMKDHLGNLQHEITASILNNTLKNRPNLSFAWYNEEGKIGGYILAYQGKMEDGTPGVYISDFAMDEKERGSAGIKMIHHWMNEVKEKYPDMPVFTRARENTSYRMIKAFAEKQGYEIAKDERVEDGGENFHRVVMNPKK